MNSFRSCPELRLVFGRPEGMELFFSNEETLSSHVQRLSFPRRRAQKRYVEWGGASLHPANQTRNHQIRNQTLEKAISYVNLRVSRTLAQLGSGTRACFGGTRECSSGIRPCCGGTGAWLLHPRRVSVQGPVDQIKLRAQFENRASRAGVPKEGERAGASLPG